MKGIQAILILIALSLRMFTMHLRQQGIIFKPVLQSIHYSNSVKKILWKFWFE